MRRTTLLIASVLLAVPALAHAKAGIEFKTYPETVAVGKPIAFTVYAFTDPPVGGGSGHPVVGAHPLVTFRSKSGRVVRVRSSQVDSAGVGHGTVAFPDKGPWSTEMTMRGVHIGDERSQPISVGTGLTETIPPADSAAAARNRANAPAPDGGFPWIWVLSIASIAAALAVAGIRHGGHWGTA